MIVRKFDVKKPETSPPSEEGWESNWDGFHGYYAMKKCVSPERWANMAAEKIKAQDKGEMTLGEFQQNCLLSILADIKTEKVNMVELGAGWGRLCLALAGALDYKVMPCSPASYRCLAVEAEPAHFEWTRQHFEIQNINGTVVNGAVSKKNGTCRFNADPSPDDCYGQAVYSFLGSRKILSIRGLLNIFRKNIIKIPMYTIDYLIKEHGFKHVDIIQMDVQGAEYDAVLGAAESIKNKLINYFLIGTHHPTLNDKLKRLLDTEFDLVIDVYPKSLGKVEGFPPIKCHDGIQLYKRKDI